MLSLETVNQKYDSDRQNPAGFSPAVDPYTGAIAMSYVARDMSKHMPFTLSTTSNG